MLLRKVARGGVRHLVFSSDNATLYTSDGSGWVSAWNCASGEQRKLFQLGSPYASIARLTVTKEGQWILAATWGSFHVWDIETKTFWPDKPILASNNHFALASDDRTFAAEKDQRTIVFSDLVLRGPHPTRPSVHIPDWIVYLDFSPTDGTLAVVGMKGALYLVEPNADLAIRINSDDAGELIEFSGSSRCCLVFSPDGRTLATCAGYSILLWDMETRQLRRRIKAGRAIVRQLAFHPDGKLLASGSDTPVVTLWDVSTGRKVNSYDWGIGKQILSLAFAPDGMTAAAGGNSGKYVLWDLDV